MEMESVKYLTWLHDLTLLGYGEPKPVKIKTEHSDLIRLMYLDALTPEEALKNYKQLTIASEKVML